MLRIYIHPVPGKLTSELFIVEEPTSVGNGSVIGYLHFNKDGSCQIDSEVWNPEIALSHKPTMILNELTLRELIQSFMELGQKRGIKPMTESKAEGKLEAQGEHLKDLRIMLKLLPGINNNGE